MTSSLFATTVVASFFVVGLPHLLPCPAPRVTYADGDIMIGEDGRRRRRKRRETPEIKDGIVNFDQVGEEETLRLREERLRRGVPSTKAGWHTGGVVGIPRTEQRDTKGLKVTTYDTCTIKDTIFIQRRDAA